MATEAELKAAGEKYIPKDYDPALYKLRHSLAHVLAQAVVEKFPQAKPTIGPPIEDGFYYDFDLEVSADEGREIFKDNPYKIELINGLAKGGQDEYGNPITGPATITIYTQDK